ncbi:MAG: SDR family NAD(P)-dependent oxidoreductase [bacterium]|nr:SDR family NAD(P)-dependent oxidoreductase [bacterium]
MLTEFEGKVAVVTGAASGIGKALCVRFAQAGMNVVLADVENDALREAGRDIERRFGDGGVEVLTVRTDVSQTDQVSALAEATLDRFGKVHVLCNNAGVFAGGRTWDAIGTDWEWVLGVNVMGVLYGIRAFVPVMLEQNEPAHVVNTCSMAGLINMPLSGVYNVSKHAALSLTETLYHELQTLETPVGVSALCPELIRTGIGRSERNRPAHLKRGDDDGSPEQEMVEAAIKASIDTGLDPSAMAERVFEGIKSDTFYLLAEEGGSWDRACRIRLEDIKERRNPTTGALSGAN